MLVSYKWLNRYVDLSNVTPKELADKMSVTGIEVEGVTVPEEGLKKIVVGEVKECVPHPDSDHLSICQVESTLPLHPVNPDNACTIRITAAAGTYLAGASYSGTVIFFPADRSLHTEILLPSRGVAASGFPPLCNIPHCCLP